MAVSRRRVYILTYCVGFLSLLQLSLYSKYPVNEAKIQDMMAVTKLNTNPKTFKKNTLRLLQVPKILMLYNLPYRGASFCWNRYDAIILPTFPIINTVATATALTDKSW